MVGVSHWWGPRTSHHSHVGSTAMLAIPIDASARVPSSNLCRKLYGQTPYVVLKHGVTICLWQLGHHYCLFACIVVLVCKCLWVFRGSLLSSHNFDAKNLFGSGWSLLLRCKWKNSRHTKIAPRVQHFWFKPKTLQLNRTWKGVWFLD